VRIRDENKKIKQIGSFGPKLAPLLQGNKQLRLLAHMISRHAGLGLAGLES
jgi:hypothetical protein